MTEINPLTDNSASEIVANYHPPAKIKSLTRCVLSLVLPEVDEGYYFRRFGDGFVAVGTKPKANTGRLFWVETLADSAVSNIRLGGDMYPNHLADDVTPLVEWHKPHANYSEAQWAMLDEALSKGLKKIGDRNSKLG